LPAEPYDVCVVGAGPAGMAAALSASGGGAKVVVVDAGVREGGQYYRQPLSGPSHLPERFQALRQATGIDLRFGEEVWSASRRREGFVVRTVNGGAVAARALVLATGATEAVLPFPGWQLPGVLTAGAAQSLLKAEGVLVGRRVVVGGAGPFLLPVASSLACAGARVTLVEATSPRRAPSALRALAAYPPKAKEAAAYAKTLAIKGARVLAGWAVVRCEGTSSVERAVVVRLGPGWSPQWGTERTLPADAVCVSFGFVPRVELARQLCAAEVRGLYGPAVKAGEAMETSVPGLFVAGELSGVAGAEAAEMEGRLAGESAASFLGLGAPPVSPPPLALTRARKFAGRLEAIYSPQGGWARWLEPSTVFCRCEEVTWASVMAAVEAGARTAREVRSTTRCGMGYCQARVCGPALQLALSSLRGRGGGDVGDLHKRPVAVPVPAGSLASGSG
jgi:NADPH-dependent 2,4-dienoyl-CoA reductase/sulfur reductase-like enzyme